MKRLAFLLIAALLIGGAVLSHGQEARRRPIVAAGGSVTFDAASSVKTTAGVGTLTSHSISVSATLLLVGVGIVDGVAVTPVTVTCGVSSMTAISGGAIVNSNSGADVAMTTYKLVNPPSGISTITVTSTGGPADLVILAASFIGANTTTPLGTAATAATNNSTTPSVTVTSATGEIVVDFEATHDNVVSMTAGSGQTSQTQQVGTGAICGGVSTEAGAASVVMDWTLSSARWSAQVGVSVKP